MLASCPVETMPPYQRLFSDAIRGSHELFAREDGVEESWRIVEPVLNTGEVYEYEPGEWGPKEAHRLPEPGDQWTDPTAPAEDAC
jgi:glucose-6-phosphate 1-dehydrogenase